MFPFLGHLNQLHFVWQLIFYMHPAQKELTGQNINLTFTPSMLFDILRCYFIFVILNLYTFTLFFCITGYNMRRYNIYIQIKDHSELLHCNTIQLQHDKHTFFIRDTVETHYPTV